MKSGHAALIGLAVAVLAIAGLQTPLLRQRSDLEAKLQVQDAALRRLAVIRVQIDDFQRRRSRLDSRIETIERLRDEAVCRWPLAGLDPSRQDGARIDGMMVEGSTLTVLGRAGDPAAVERLATEVRGAPWAQEVKAGPNAAGTFGLFARVEAPKCHPPKKADAGAETRP